MGVRGKLFGVSLVLIGTVGMASGWFLEGELRKLIVARIQQEVMHTAGAARVALQARADGPQESPNALAQEFGEAAGMRVTVISADGTVLGDSQVDPNKLQDVENHGNRPEVVAAMQKGHGTSRRYSTTLETEMLYVALRRPGGTGVVRTATPLSSVEEAVNRLRLLLLLAGGLGLLVAVSMSGLASSVASRALQGLVDSARDMASGGSGRMEVASRDELGLLAGSFNKLSDELKNSMRRLAKERDRLRTVLQSMSEGVLVLNQEGNFTLTNPAALEMLGMDEPQKGESIGSAGVQELTELAERGRLEVAAGEFVMPDRQRTLLASANPVRAAGGTVIVLHDMTEARRLEQIRRDFVANVSHELRTPVSVIRANSETLLDGAMDDPDQARPFVEASLRNSERLTNLIADLLDLARIEAGAYPLQAERISLAAAARRALDAVHDQAKRRGTTLVIEVDDALEAVADRKALDQILVNLLDNAVKYAGDGGHVAVRAEPAADVVRVSVEDDGPGIDAEHRSRVFQRFYRVDAGRSRAVGGTGLGLSITKHLAGAMGGAVGVEPAQPQGCIFWFTLPAEGGLSPTANPV